MGCPGHHPGERPQMESHRCWLCLLSGDCEGLFGVLNTQVMPFAVRLRKKGEAKREENTEKWGARC